MGRKKFKEYGVREILAALQEVVDEHGADYVYEKAAAGDGLSVCRYMHGQEVPGCLIGRVLIHLGAQPRVIWAAEESYIQANGHGLGVEEFLNLLTPTWSTLGYTITGEAQEVLTVAQNCQDVSNTWGQALRQAQNVADVSV